MDVRNLLCIFILQQIFTISQSAKFSNLLQSGNDIHKGETIFILLVFTLSQTGAEVSPYVSPGYPACYVAKTGNEIVEGTTQPCYWGCDGNYLYCSSDHYCCLVDGCPACCTTRNSPNRREVIGIVIGIVVVFIVAIAVTYFAVGRFLKRSKGVAPQ